MLHTFESLKIVCEKLKVFVSVSLREINKESVVNKEKEGIGCSYS